MFSMEYDVDIVMCIDATGSMAPIIDTVKRSALQFNTQLAEAMELNDKAMGVLRMKVITFKDFNVDSDPLQESEFFTLPEQNAEFEAYVKGITVGGGGDTPENALDAIATAMKSDWTQGGWKRRHIVVMFTDAPAIPLNEGNHPSGMPTDLKELQSWWNNGVPGGNMQLAARRLVLFTPDAEPWNIIQGWDLVAAENSAAAGCADIDMSNIIKEIVKSIGTVAVQ